MTDDEERRAMRIMLQAGMMPSDVEDSLRDARQAGDEPPSEADIVAGAEVTDADVERGRAWWLFIEAVPRRFKRLLTARERQQGEE